MKRFAAVTAGLLSTFVIACGGSGTGSAPDQAALAPAEETSSLTKDEFIAQADEICTEFGEDTKHLDSLLDTATENDDYEKTADGYERIAEAGTDLVADLRALDYDGEDSEVIDEFLRTNDEQMAQTAKLADALREFDFGKLTAIAQSMNKREGRAQGLAEGFGLRECAFRE